MWGNLAGRLNATDINATLEKIGNAVAPREDDDDDEYYDEDDGSDGDYDDYDEDEDDGEGIINKVAGATPFRLAGMLTNALENRRAEIKVGGDSYKADITDDKEITGSTFQTNEEILCDDNKIDEAFTRRQEDRKQIGDTLERADTSMPIESQVSKFSTNQITSHGSNNEAMEIDVSPKEAEDVVIGFQNPAEKEIEPALSNAKKVETNRAFNRSGIKRETDNSIMINNVRDESMVTTTTSTSLNNNRGNLAVMKQSISVPHKVMKKETKVELSNENKRIVDGLPRAGKTNEVEVVSDAKRISRLTLAKDCTDSATNIRPSPPASKLTEATAKIEVSPSLDTNEMEDESKPCEESKKGVENASIMTASNTSSSISAETISPPVPPIDNMTPIQSTRSRSDPKSINTKENNEQKLIEAELYSKELQSQLAAAKQEVAALLNQAQQDKERARFEKDNLIAQFHSKETRLLQATSEENQNQTLLLQQEHSAKIQSLEHSLTKQQKESQDEQAEYKRLLRDSYSEVDRLKSQLQTAVNKHGKEIAQVKQREERALRKVDDRMAQTMAVLDERDEEIKRLKEKIRNTESKLNEHQEGEEEAEEELEEAHQENDTLRQTIENLELEKKNLKEQILTLKSGSEELSGLQIELTLLKEERDREKAKNLAFLDSTLSSRTQFETERDNALSELKDLKQQLAAARGDLEISRADCSRTVMANENLQSALEAFQDERRAEMEMIDEQRRQSEETLRSAHVTATNALKQIHETEIYDVQKASDDAVKNAMQEMELVESNLEKAKSENYQMRRSLDEAIHRLQTTQEDVIDRNVMKNILLDWCTLNDKSKRQQVLQVMANLLHFSEEEREKVHLTSKSLESVRAQVVGALAAPLPPSKADVEHLEGSNVHEKWVNFLMAETDDA